MSFKQFLSEKILNLFSSDTDKMGHYAHEVYNILQNSYQSIGGIKGSGFSSPEEMIEKIPMWKLGIRGGKVKAVIMYKDKNGRKSVAIGTDGTDEGKLMLNMLTKPESNRAYGEISGPSLILRLRQNRNLPIISFDEVKKITNEPIIPYSEEVYDQLQDNDKRMVDSLKKIRPDILSSAYIRDIGGEKKLKVMFGKSNLPIIDKNI